MNVYVVVRFDDKSGDISQLMKVLDTEKKAYDEIVKLSETDLIFGDNNRYGIRKMELV